jgi:hypothetical protein
VPEVRRTDQANQAGAAFQFLLRELPKITAMKSNSGRRCVMVQEVM